MKVVIKESYADMSRMAADIFVEIINQKSECVLGLATGDTPIGMYECLVEDYKAGKVDFAGVKSVNLDEYYPITPDNEQSYRYFMNYHLFDKMNINKADTYVPDGQATNVAKSCEAYEKNIDALGGIDVQVLGIGRNGHVGFNEPDCELYPYTHVTDLTANTIEANSRFFESEDDVPKQALTMGIESIFKARKIVILASGEGKAEAVKAMLGGKITTKCPASLLRLHPDVTLICDKNAAKFI
ncbi:MAG: glucosamine-6-phosphate deaminase [Clostridia bacterium]|nr:glucosamine-6-phosphate deaminase [Clostridia bacterium]